MKTLITLLCLCVSLLAQSKTPSGDDSFNRLLQSYGGSGDTLDYAKVSAESRERYDRFSKFNETPKMPASGTISRADYVADFNSRMAAMGLSAKGGKDADSVEKLQRREAELVKELDAVRLKLKDLKAAKPAAPAKTYTDAKSLLADLPESDYPKAGANGSVERAKADAWLAKHLPGRVVEWSMPIGMVTDSRRGAELFGVSLKGEAKSYQFSSRTIAEHGALMFGEPVKFGAEPAAAFIASLGYDASLRATSNTECWFDIVTGKADDVLRLRKASGTTAKLRGTIASASLQESAVKDFRLRSERGEWMKELPIVLRLKEFAIDGHVYGGDHEPGR